MKGDIKIIYRLDPEFVSRCMLTSDSTDSDDEPSSFWRVAPIPIELYRTSIQGKTGRENIDWLRGNRSRLSRIVRGNASIRIFNRRGRCLPAEIACVHKKRWMNTPLLCWRLVSGRGLHATDFAAYVPDNAIIPSLYG